uniref:NACHT C-terminal Cysteine and Histidine-containing domain-containing protein n=1 Tax=Desertifilum tharense IPPAS B-1220 TaxID=1781255 RepID=A0A1E5QFW9_9CYAN|nr:hypothetical protein BH720_19160 [Desertifilum tharense IPPAS B-1220]
MFYALQCLNKVATRNVDIGEKDEMVDTLIIILNGQEDFASYRIKLQALWALGNTGAGNEAAFNMAMNIIHNSDDTMLRINAPIVLCRILQNVNFFKLAITQLKTYVLDPQDRNPYALRYGCYVVLWHCAQNLSYPEFYSAWNG